MTTPETRALLAHFNPDLLVGLCGNQIAFAVLGLDQNLRQAMENLCQEEQAELEVWACQLDGQWYLAYQPWDVMRRTFS